MRLAIPLVALLAVASPRNGCGSGNGQPWVPCEGKVCGDACRTCAPNDPGCVETADAKACDRAGRCVPSTAGLCDPAVAACAGKACGDACTLDPPCRSATPAC